MKIRRTLRYITSGRFLLLLKVDKYMGQIIYAFIMAIILIGLNLAIAGTVHRCEENKKVVEALYARKTECECELTSLHSISMLQKMLRKKGSELDIPEKPAERLR